MPGRSRNWFAVITIVLTLAIGVSACAAPAPAPAPAPAQPAAPAAQPTAAAVPAKMEPAADKKIKVAFMVNSPIGDLGWSYNGFTALKKACSALPYCELIGYSESVKDTDIEPYMRDYAQKGANLIVAHSFGYWEQAKAVSKDFPDIAIVYPGGDATMIADRVGTYYPRAEETTYLAGMMAALMSKSKQTGFIVSMPTPLINAECWGFRQGVEATDPSVKFRTVATNSFYDPALEREAAVAMIDQGVDFLGYNADDPAIVQAAGEKGKLAVGIFTDVSQTAPNAVVMSMLWPWENYFTWLIKSLHEGTWKSSVELWGIKEGGTDITPFGSMVPKDVQDKVTAARQDIIDGKLKVKLITDACDK